MPVMTTAHPRANWSRTPSPIHHWLEALLRAFAMLWSNLADIVRMRPSRLPRECHTDATPASLPQQDRDPIKEHAPGPPPSTTTTTTTTTTTSGCRTAAANASSRETTEALLPRSEAHPPNERRVLQPEDWLAAAGNYTPDRQRDCHPGSAKPIPKQGWPGPISQHRDSQTHGSRLSSAHALAVGMTGLVVARFRCQDSRAPS